MHPEKTKDGRSETAAAYQADAIRGPLCDSHLEITPNFDKSQYNYDYAVWINNQIMSFRARPT